MVGDRSAARSSKLSEPVEVDLAAIWIERRVGIWPFRFWRDTSGCLKVLPGQDLQVRKKELVDLYNKSEGASLTVEDVDTDPNLRWGFNEGIANFYPK